MLFDRALVAAAVTVLALGAPASAQTDPAAPATPSPAPAAVTGAAAWDLLKGNTVTGRVAGDSFAEYFDAAGGVRYVDKDGLSTGTWTLKSPKVCFDFPDDDDRSCSTFTVTGNAGSAVDDDNVTTRFDILPGNSKGL